MFVSDTKKLNLVGVCIACVALPLDTDGSGPETITQRQPWLMDYDPSECRASSLSKRALYSEAPILLGSGNAPHREGKGKSIPCLIKEHSGRLAATCPRRFHSPCQTSTRSTLGGARRQSRTSNIGPGLQHHPGPMIPSISVQTRPGRGWPVRPQRPRHLATACVLPEFDHLPPPHILLDSLGYWSANDSPV